MAQHPFLVPCVLTLQTLDDLHLLQRRHLLQRWQGQPWPMQCSSKGCVQ